MPNADADADADRNADANANAVSYRTVGVKLVGNEVQSKR